MRPLRRPIRLSFSTALSAPRLLAGEGLGAGLEGAPGAASAPLRRARPAPAIASRPAIWLLGIVNALVFFGSMAALAIFLYEGA